MLVDLGYGGWNPSDEDDPPDNRGKVMGDMADFALDCAMDECEDYDRFAAGQYDPQETYDRGFTNEFGGEERGPKGWNTLFQRGPRTRHTPKQISCNKCGSIAVYWDKVSSGKWCLHTNGEPHVCETKKSGKAVLEQPAGLTVPRTGKNSNMKELTGYRLILVKCCDKCYYFSGADKCKKHNYSVVPRGVCNDWENDDL